MTSWLKKFIVHIWPVLDSLSSLTVFWHNSLLLDISILYSLVMAYHEFHINLYSDKMGLLIALSV